MLLFSSNETTTKALRLLGYSAVDGKIECERQPGPRYAHEATAMLTIDLEHGGKDARGLIDALIEMADEPAALIGRGKHGSVVLLFRAEPNINVEAQITGAGRGKFKLVLLPAGERITITCQPGGMLDPREYSWEKGRSPTDVRRDDLPVMFAHIGEEMVESAMRAGCVWLEEFERREQDEERGKQIERDLASGKIKIETDEERFNRKDDELVEAHEGTPFSSSDGPYAEMVIRARRRVAARKGGVVETTGRMT